MRVIWEVKCYRCSRVCGMLMEAPRAFALLADSARVLKAPLCDFVEGKGLRCTRCGGQLYTEEAERVYEFEAPQATSSLN